MTITRSSSVYYDPFDVHVDGAGLEDPAGPRWLSAPA